MPHLLARLGPRTAPDRRVLHTRGRDRDDVVSPAIQQLGEGRVVLLEGEEPPWIRAVPARLSAWPDDLNDLVRVGAPMKRGLDELWGARGLWALDPHGEPCELVWGRDPDEVALLLNYSGWRFADLPPGPLAVTMARSTLGTVWILDPDAAPHPRHAVAVVEPRERPVLRTSRIGASHRETPTAPPQP